MKLTTATALVLALSLPLTGCDTLNELLGVEEESASVELTTSILTGAVLGFSNPSPNTSIGEHAQWDYSFQSGKAYGCNSERGYESSGWSIVGSNSVRVQFGSQYEQYELTASSGSLSTGDLTGTFHLTSSVPGNVVDGTFVQRPTSRFSGCRP